MRIAVAKPMALSTQPIKGPWPLPQGDSSRAMPCEILDG